MQKSINGLTKNMKTKKNDRSKILPFRVFLNKNYLHLKRMFLFFVFLPVWGQNIFLSPERDAKFTDGVVFMF